MTYTWGGIIIFWPLSWDDDNWRSMLHNLGIFYHALSAVMRRWQLTDPVSYMNDILPCCDRCHESMTTDRAWIIPKGWITMLWTLSWEYENWQSWFHTLGENAPSVVIVSWQRSEHAHSFLRYESCSVSCHSLMTLVKAWKYIIHLWNMVRQLSSSYCNGQSMVMHPLGIKHAPSVVIASWQRSGHGNISISYKSCSVICHHLMTTFRTCWYPPHVWNLLRQMSSSHDNGQSMVIYHSCMKHALSVVIVSRQRSEHGYISLKYESCSVICLRLMTTVRAWWYIIQVWKMLRQLSSSHDNGQSMVIYHS